jgi:hypothetical protein
MPSRSTGNDTGSPISPRSPLVNHTRLLTLPGSTATTSADAGTARRNNSTTSHLLTNRQGTSLPGKSLTLKVAQELSAVRPQADTPQVALAAAFVALLVAGAAASLGFS